MRTSRQIIVAGTSSRLASAMQSTALMIFSIGHSGSVQLAALVGLVSVLPAVFLSGLCTRAFRLLGTRRVVTFALTASLALALALPPLRTILDGSQGMLSPQAQALWLAIALVFGILRPFVENGINLLVVSSVTKAELEEVNAQLSTAQAVGSIAAPALIGLVANNSMTWAFLAVGLAFALSAVMTWHLQDFPHSSCPSPKASQASGRFRLPRMLLVLAIIGMLSNIAAGVFNASYPVIVLTDMQLSHSQYGLCGSLINAGLVAGNLVYMRARQWIDPWSFAALATVVRLSALVVFVAAMGLPTLLLLCLCYGLTIGGWNAGSSTASLHLAHGDEQEALLPRYRSLVFLGTPIGSLLAIALASAPTGARLLICLLLWGVCMIWMLLERPAFAREYA